MISNNSRYANSFCMTINRLMMVKTLWGFSDFRNKIPVTARYENMRTIRIKEKLSSTPARMKFKKIKLETTTL